MPNISNQEKRYDFIVVGAGAAGSVLAAELSASGAQVLVIESGGPDDAPTILNPSVWFYNVGGPLDYHLPVAPSPRLNNRKFNMALGHVLGGGSTINVMVWMRGMQRDYDGWAENGAKGWSFADVLPVFKSQEDWEGGANEWRGTGGPVPAENSIALKSVNSAREGTNSSVSENACRIAECERPRRYRLPERRVTAARYVYILKRKRLLKLLVVHIDGEVLPPVAVQ
jgi:choline dehydrogenase-like flavoprotein